MHRIFQRFVDGLDSAENARSLRLVMSEAAAALDLSSFAYLSLPQRSRDTPLLISNYPVLWTKHYMEKHYERFDPVIIQVFQSAAPFQWGLSAETTNASKAAQELFERAAQFGIRYGFTIPIHNNSGPVAAMTFAADERRPQFERNIREHGRVLQLMAMSFHAHCQRSIGPNRPIADALLSPREAECLGWAAQGKSAWEIGTILGISRHTVATYLENAKTKLGVRTIVQAVARVAHPNQTRQPPQQQSHLP
jgi:LuxR family transcriptional activator of conjugal transfer of Ti plasmids